MKKLLALFMLTLMCVGGWAQTVIATMSDLVGAAMHNDATVSTDWIASEGDVYQFGNGTYIGGITNDAVLAALEGDGYVTVAMYVYGNSLSGCPFGYGDASDGLKYMISGTNAKLTTKGVDDFDIKGLGSMSANAWNLVAFTVPGKANSTATQSRYLSPAGHYSVNNTITNMNDPATGSKKFAIGSGDQGTAREAYSGLIANVTVITSSALIDLAAVKSKMADMPQMTENKVNNLKANTHGFFGNIVKRATEPATTIEEGWYVLNNVGRGNCPIDNGTQFKMATLLNSGYVALTESNVGCLFHITASETEGKWNIASVFDHYVSLGSNSSSQTSDKHDFTFELIQGQTNVFCIKDDNTGYYADGQATGNNFVGWSTNKPTGATGNDAYRLYKVEDAVVTAATLSNLQDAKWYQLNVRNKYIKYDANSKTYYDTYDSQPEATDSTSWFAFVGNNTDGYKILNYAAGANVAMGAVNTNTDTRLKAVPVNEGHSYIFKNVTYNNAPAIQIYEKNSGSAYLNQQGTNLGYWNGGGNGDIGNVFTFAEVEDIANYYVTYTITATKGVSDPIKWTENHFVPTTTEDPSFDGSAYEFFSDFSIINSKPLAQKRDFTVTAQHTLPFQEGKFYLLKNRYTDNHVAVDANEKTYARSTREMLKANYLWSFERVENTPDQFYIKNLDLDKYLSGTSDVVSYNENKINAYTIWKDTQTNTTDGFCLHLASSSSTNDVCIGSHAAGSGLDSNFPNSVHSNGNASLSVWSRGGNDGARKDNGSIFWVEEFDESLLPNENDIKNFAGYVGFYTEDSAEDYCEAKSSYDSEKNGTNLKSLLNTLSEMESDKIEFANNKFYYLRNVGSIAEVASDNKFPYSWLTSTLWNDNRMKISHEQDPDVSAIFFYNGTNLIGYKDGLYVNENTTSLDAYDWTLENFDNVSYMLKNGNNYLTYWGWEPGNSSNSTNYYALMKSERSDWAAWYLKEVTALPVTLHYATDGLYGTAYFPINVKLPEGVKAYVATNEGTHLNLVCIANGDESMSNVLPKETPVILTKDGTESSVTLKFEVGGDAEDFTGDNILEGQVNTKATVENAYTLGGMSGIGFYKYTGDKLNGFKAYLTYAKPLSAAFSFNIVDDLTGIIENGTATESNAPYFNLQGQKVVSPIKGNLYIRGGKVIKY